MNTFWHTLKFLLRELPKRIFFLYLVIFLLSLPIAKYGTAIMAARSSALSRFIPSFEYLIQFRDQSVRLDKTQMKEYLEYFRKVDAYLPDKADVLSMLGYCSYYLGRERDAQGFYLRANTGYPFSFAYHYNLGALAFKKKDYTAASTYLTKALQTSFMKNLSFITSSRLYFPIFKEPKKIDLELTDYLQIGYEHCYRLLVLSYAELNDPNKQLSVCLQAAKQPGKDPGFFYYHAGLAARKLRAYNEAVFFLKKALELDPHDSAALAALSQTFDDAGETLLGKKIAAEEQKFKVNGKDRRETPEEIILQIY